MRTPGLLIVLSLFTAGTLWGAENEIIEHRNDFGGKTEQISYSQEDKEYKLKRKLNYYDSKGVLRKAVGFRQMNRHNELKIEKAAEYFSEAGKLMRREIEIDELKARQIGYDRVITHYNAEGQIVKKAFYYVKTDFGDLIYDRSVDYFEINGDRVKSEYFLSKEESLRSGFHKLVATYENGKLIKQELVDERGVTY